MSRSALAPSFLFLATLITPALLAADLPARRLDPAQLLEFLDDAGHRQPVRTPADWPRRRESILAGMQQVMGAPPAPSPNPPLDLKVLATEQADGYTRQTISYDASPGPRATAYLLLPQRDNPALTKAGKRPAVLALHPTGALGKGIVVGLGTKPNRAYAAELARRGYVVLAPDYPTFGDQKDADPYKHGYASGTMMGIRNHLRGADLLCSTDGVDPRRLGTIGHSLGGHNALFLAAFDPRIKAAVTSCGFTSFPRYYNGNLTGWTSPRYMPRITTVYNKDPARMPFDFPEVLAAIAPRAVFVSAPVKDDNFDVTGVKACVAAAAKVYDLLGANDKLKAEYPEGGHDFPDPMRTAAYEFLDRELGAR